MQVNLYQKYGLNKTIINQDEINQLFKRLSKKLHPDFNKSKNAKEEFIEFYEDFSILRNEILRNEYNKSLNSEIMQDFTVSNEEAAFYASNAYSLFVKKVLSEIASTSVAIVVWTGSLLLDAVIKILIAILLFVPFLTGILIETNNHEILLIIHIVATSILYVYAHFASKADNIYDFGYKQKFLKLKEVKLVIFLIALIYNLICIIFLMN